MNCEDAGRLLSARLDEPDGAGQRLVTEHLATCEGCRDALRAVKRLRAERNMGVPQPAPGALGRALRAATATARIRRRRRTGEFWKGVSAGAAAAAVVAAVAVSLVLSGRMPGGALPEVTVALHEPREVSIAIQAPEALRDAEIHVMLRGAVELQGFEGQRDVQWTTDLEAGVNELRLPVVATGEQGGQVQVVVNHGNRQKTFFVDVHAGRAG